MIVLPRIISLRLLIAGMLLDGSLSIGEEERSALDWRGGERYADFRERGTPIFASAHVSNRVACMHSLGQ